MHDHQDLTEPPNPTPATRVDVLSATGLGNQWTAANDPVFIQRVTMSVLQAAQNIANEGSAVANHTARSSLATAASKDALNSGIAFARMLAAQGLDSSSSDTAINKMVASVWNTIAGGL